MDRPGRLALGELLTVQAIEVVGGELGEADPLEGGLEVEPDLVLVVPEPCVELVARTVGLLASARRRASVAAS